MASSAGKLAGKVIFITGASRGIGRAIALRAAQDGAKIIIAAKTKEPHPKLPGTIYTVAEEVEKAGGQALPCVVDIRYEDQVAAAVDQGIKAFGKLDILVNNASAISLTNTSNTTMKSYDLMNGINTRGTFLCSKVCLPHLKKAGPGSHILNISPPLNMAAKWFQNHVAYTIAKYGMSLCALGMSEELKDSGIAVNALWPKIAIYTAAMKMLGGGDEVAAQCRKPSIMADAAYSIFCQPASYTGHFVTDEQVLRDLSGVQDFSEYACVPGTPEKNMIIDFFLESDQFEVEQSPVTTQVPGGSVNKSFEKIETMLGADAVKFVNSSFAFVLTGGEPGTWYLDLKTGNGSCGSLEQNCDLSKFDVQFNMTSEDFIKMFNNELAPTKAFMTGKLKIKGDALPAMKLETLMGKKLPKL